MSRRHTYTRTPRKQPRQAYGEPGTVLGEVAAVYNGSDGDATKAMYDRLLTLGPVGVVAVNVFRAQKNSERAKAYRGGVRGQGSYKSMAYERKSWSIDKLAQELNRHAQALGFGWGWAVDAQMSPDDPMRHILYVELPSGQVSWHTSARGVGPDYAGRWDGAIGYAPKRICQWVATLLEAAKAPA